MVNCDFIFIAFTKPAYLSKEIVYFELAIFKFCGFGCDDLDLRVAQAGQVIVNREVHLVRYLKYVHASYWRVRFGGVGWYLGFLGLCV
jgi:hypothetical protein